MAKKLKSLFADIDTLNRFKGLKRSVDSSNSKYVIGDSTTPIDGEPDIKWEQICFIKDSKLIYARGVYYNGEDLQSIIDSLSFIGEETTIELSGTPEMTLISEFSGDTIESKGVITITGTNSESDVLISATTVNVSKITQSPKFELEYINDDSETLNMNWTDLQSTEHDVWNGYTDAKATAQTFTANEATITVTGTTSGNVITTVGSANVVVRGVYTPKGSVTKKTNVIVKDANNIVNDDDNLFETF